MNAIVDKLGEYKEFEHLLPKIDDDINKKGYSIFQVFSNEDIIRTIDELEKQLFFGRGIINNQVIENILKIQDQTTFIVFKDLILYNGISYDLENIDKILQQYKKDILNFKKFGSIRKEIKNMDFYSKNLTMIRKLKPGYKKSYNYFNQLIGISIYFGPIIGFFVYVTYISSKAQLNQINEDNFGFYEIIIICCSTIFLYGFIKELITNFIRKKIFPIPKSISKARKKYNKTQKTNFLYQLKSVEDDIQEIENLNLEKIDLQKSFESDFSSLKNYENLTSKISNLLISITQKLQNFQTEEIEKYQILSFAKNNFNIVIKNWINILSNIQNQLQVLNSETKTDNQKLFVKTTDALNQNINIIQNQLETLKI